MRIGQRCWRCFGRRARAGATRVGTTARSWRPSTTSRSTTSPGGRCRPPSASGTASGSGVSRLSQAGVFEAFFEALANLSRTAHLVQMFDSTVVRAHISAAGAKGGNTARLWAARGGASRPRSISRSIWMGCRSLFTVDHVGGEILPIGSNLVRPPIRIPPQASAVHHVTDEDVAHCPTIEDMLPTYMDLDGADGVDVFVAHS